MAKYDAIVVGARCAGSPVAMLLARKGHRVLLLDRARFPSDTLSTHIVWPHGAEALDRWGLYDRLAETGCPPIALDLTFDVGPFALRGRVRDANRGRGGFCPRRTVLDEILVEGAVEAGVDLREGFTVDDVVREGDRVVGVAGRGGGGTRVEDRAAIVIGADGAHSRVAKVVEAEEYGARPPIATFYYAYYSGFGATDIEQYSRVGHAVGCFATHDGQTLMVAVWPTARFQEIRADVETHASRLFASIPPIADRLSSAKRETKWVGTAGVANCFRKPFGPGWALVGDAGYDRDPLTAQGMTDAFLDAEALAEAVDAGLSGRRPIDEALADYQAARDRRVMPMYEFTCALAKLEPAPPPMPQLFAALRTNQEETDRFYSAITGATPLPAFMNPENIGRIVGGAGLGEGT